MMVGVMYTIVFVAIYFAIRHGTGEGRASESTGISRTDTCSNNYGQVSALAQGDPRSASLTPPPPACLLSLALPASELYKKIATRSESNSCT